MKRAQIAYINCRVDAAELYFLSALEIAIIREQANNSVLFTSIQLTKPLEFIIEIYLVESAFDKAIELLSNVSELNLKFHSIPREKFLDLIQTLYEKVELAEKRTYTKVEEYTSSKDLRSAMH